MLRLAGPRNALGHRPEPEVLPLPAETSREAPKCCAWQHQGGGGPNQVLRLAASREGGPETRSGTVQSLKWPLPAETSREAPKCCAWSIKKGGPETRSGTVQSLKCCPCQQKRAARLPSAALGSIKEGGGQTKCCAWQHQGRGGPRNALGYRPEPEVLPLPAETSREAAKCCAWEHKERGPETRSGTVQSLKCCPCQQKRAARLPSAAPGSIKGGAPKRRPEPEVLPLPAKTSREAPKCCAWQHQGGGPRNALGHRPEPEVLPLPAETSREAPKCVSSVKRARAP